jgi:hypothetical protein
MGRCGAIAALALVTLSACAAEAPPIADPEGLPADALSLAYILDQGCIPFIRGERSERAAMEGVGLRRVQVFSFPDPPPPPHWIGRYAGVSAVNVSSDRCSIHVIGRHAADYFRATARVLHERLGADIPPEALQSLYERSDPPSPLVPHGLNRTYSGCARGVRYTFALASPPLSRGWDVSLGRGC